MPKPPKPDDIELHPDAWDRFERFVATKVPVRPAAPAKAKKPAKARKAPRKA